MTAQKIKVLGAGAALLDVLAHVDDDFVLQHAGEKGGMIMLSPDEIGTLIRLAESAAPISRASGGSAANTLCGLAQLGIPAALFGKIGADENGAVYRDFYASKGGLTSSFKVNPQVATGSCLCLITPDSQRTMRTDLGASGTLTADDVTDADFDGVTHLHLEGYLLYNMPVTRTLLAAAKRFGCTVSFDLASFEVVRTFRDDIKQLLAEYVDLIFANEDEAAAFSGSEDPMTSLQCLRELCHTVCVKVGKNGAYIASENTPPVHVPAELVTAVDTTGAGDLWQTGFLYGWLRGKENALSGRYGAAVAAEVVQLTGAQITEARWDVLRQRLAEME